MSELDPAAARVARATEFDQLYCHSDRQADCLRLRKSAVLPSIWLCPARQPDSAMQCIQGRNPGLEDAPWPSSEIPCCVYNLSMAESENITQLLADAGAGDHAAWDRLVHLVYPDLKRLAQRSLGAGKQLTLNTTALVHECYLRLSRAHGAPRDRGHLMSTAVRIMRQVLIDHARERLALKRGGGLKSLAIDDVHPIDETQFERLIEIDAALKQLAVIEPRQAEVFEHRYFGGLNDDETALALSVSARTVHRDWDAGRAWLAQHLNHA
jgi:RNA polymerase sigma factor (TIGR02999 family)